MKAQKQKKQDAPTSSAQEESGKADPTAGKKHKEIGGPAGPEPTRYGDWEIGGKCVDF